MAYSGDKADILAESGKKIRIEVLNSGCSRLQHVQDRVEAFCLKIQVFNIFAFRSPNVGFLILAQGHTPIIHPVGYSRGHPVVVNSGSG